MEDTSTAITYSTLEQHYCRTLQGLLLSVVPFLFYNADLVQYKIGANGSALAFVDDYTAWVTGSSAEANRIGIQAVIDKAVNWERRSGAQFEGEKTAIIHFTRNKERTRLQTAYRQDGSQGPCSRFGSEEAEVAFPADSETIVHCDSSLYDGLRC